MATFGEDNPHAREGRLIRRVTIEMRDGIQLSAILALPGGLDPAPTVFRLTPYLADTFYSDGPAFNARGYAYLCADVRGRGDSGGGPYVQVANDAQDGFDCIAWIASQAWSNGDVVMSGSSYSGTNQWIIAAAQPPALKAIAPSGVSLVGFDYPAPGGALPASVFQVLTFTDGRSLNPSTLADTERWTALLADIWRKHERLNVLPQRTGMLSNFFQRIWETAPSAAAFVSCDMDSDAYRRVRTPVLSITGLADMTCPGTLEAHRRFLAVANEKLASQSRFLLGPWDHLGIETGSDRVGDLQFSPAAKLDVRKLKIDWFDWVLGRGPAPIELNAPVRYYVSGAEEWRDASSIDCAASAGARHFHLTSTGQANDLFASGRLIEGCEASPPDSFVCDPHDFSAVSIETEQRHIAPPVKENAPTIRLGPIYNDLSTVLCGADPTNDRFAAALGRHGLVYHSPPFDTDLEIVGHPKARLWLRADAPDADLAILLSVVAPGATTAIALSSDFIRLRFRNGLDREDLVPINTPFLLERPLMWFAARRIKAGSRLRLVVRNGASIRKEKNLHSGARIQAQAPPDARIATIALLHDLDHPSTIELPIQA